MTQLPEFKNKKVLVMGLGFHGGGIGAVRFFVKQRAKVTVTDLKSKDVLKDAVQALAKYRPKYVLGHHRKVDFQNADLIFKSPDVPNSSLYLEYARSIGKPILDAASLFLTSCPAEVIGITGTKGKSTTALLLAGVLRKHYGSKRKVWLLGTPGTSILEALPKIRKQDLVILELSSFQLEDLHNAKKSPEIAIFTSLFPDHLNRHKTFRDYARAKSAIFKYQSKSGYLVVPDSAPWLKFFTKQIPGKVLKVNPKKYQKVLREAYGWTPAEKQNFALVFKVAELFGAKTSVMRSALTNLKRLPGRCEVIRVFKGITFINNTTATNPGAALNALEYFGKKQKLIVIAGGSDKKLDFKDFAKGLSKYAKVIIFLPGKGTERIKKLLSNSRGMMIFETSSMKEAVNSAYELARRGDIVILSPGAASFGLFQHEFDRGNQFNACVRALK